MKTKTQSLEQKRAEATRIVMAIRRDMAIDKLTRLVGLSKVTLYTRMRRSNWKVPEMTHIDTLKEHIIP